MATDRRQQIRLSRDEQAAFFRDRKKAALATIDKDGFPHVVAMNYFARDGAFWAQASASPVQPGARASAPKRVVLKIVPEKVVSWDHRKLGGRY
jgi:general stress protein 26